MNTVWENTAWSSFLTMFWLCFLCFTCLWLEHATREAKRQDEELSQAKAKLHG